MDVDAAAVLAPVQALLEAVFDAVHEVALLLDQLSVLESPEVTDVGLADSDTDGVVEDVLVARSPLQAVNPKMPATTQYAANLKPDIAPPDVGNPQHLIAGFCLSLQ